MTGIHHIAIRVSDCALSAQFYEGAFALREISRVERDGELRAVWLQAGGAVLMLERSVRGEGPNSGSGHVLIFSVSDLAAAEDRFKQFGVRVFDRTTSTLYVQDPDGHRAGVSEHRFDGLIA